MGPVLDALLRTGGPLAVAVGIFAIVAWRGLALARIWHEARVAHDTKILAALEGVTNGVRELTAELRGANRDAIEHRGRVDARLERLEANVIKAIGEDGEQTREALADKRLSDVARAVEEASQDEPASRSRRGSAR